MDKCIYDLRKLCSIQISYKHPLKYTFTTRCKFWFFRDIKYEECYIADDNHNLAYSEDEILEMGYTIENHIVYRQPSYALVFDNKQVQQYLCDSDAELGTEVQAIQEKCDRVIWFEVDYNDTK